MPYCAKRGGLKGMIRLKVKDLAELRGWNQKQLAERSGVSVFVLLKYWHSRISRVDLIQLEKLADALEVPPGDLLEKV